jgi:hypothetical protein
MSKTFQILQNMADALATSGLVLENQSRDGRVNSSRHEDQIIDKLRQLGFGEDVFIVGPQRWWWDIWLVETNTPVNIKSSTHKTADNACNWLSLLWILTDNDIDMYRASHGGNDSSEMMDYLESGRTPQMERDYAFFSVNKKNPNDTIITSLRYLNEATINANNMPFQIHWDKNRTLTQRTYTEMRDFYLNVINETKERDWKMKMFRRVGALCEKQ